MPQTSVSLNQDTAIQGMIAKLRPVDIFTGCNKESDDTLNFGDPVYISSFTNTIFEVKQLDKTATNTTRVDGFVVYDSRMDGKILNNQSVGVVRKGFIWTVASWFSGAVSAGNTVVYDLSAGKFIANTIQWDVSSTLFKNTATVAAGDIVVPGVRVWTALTAAEATAGTKLVLTELNLPDFQAVAVA